MAGILHGDAQGNSLAVTADKTQVYGLAGNDVLTSANHSDVLLIGGSGDDYLGMTGGNGTLSGGSGADIFEFDYNMTQPLSAVIEDINPTSDKIFVKFIGDTTPQLTSVKSGDDVVWTTGDGYFNLTLKSSSDASDYFDGTAGDEIWEVFRLTNNEREKQNLPWLTLSQGLTDGAAIRSQEIVINFSHTRPDGTGCFTAVAKEYQWDSGNNSYYIDGGENIAAGNDTAAKTVDQWMNSPGHRANILDSTYGYTMLGVGHTQATNSTYGNYWVQMFSGGLKYPDTLSTAEILSADIVVDTTASTTPSTTTGQVISNYAGEPVTLSGSFMGAAFSGNNFVVNSSTGIITIQNVTDKVVDIRNSAGNEFIKAYEASNAGVIDGRGINAYEIIQGASNGADVILAGDGGSQLWGGADTAADAIAGGNGTDIFIGGRFQGADSFLNASSADIVSLNDALLSDIVAAGEVNGTIFIGFNTGNGVAIQSSEALSAAIVLSDGSAWRYNHVAKSWQGA